ncbi:MAG: hypothetical protein HYT10_01785 [Candidatus Levybacteria bacterium]|nr:hypothetical protein [Candidatus Levybacteria bacterium]
MESPMDVSGIRIITVSGRIASGSTTLARKLARHLGWKHLEGGEIFWEAIRKKTGFAAKDTHLRPDEEDELFDAELKRILREETHIVLETKLAGFNAQGIPNIFKILVLCNDKHGIDQPQIRIDRLVNREKVPVEEAKTEVLEREHHDIEKWRKLYALGNQEWVYWNESYYDLIINTYSHNAEETLQIALAALPL